MTLHPKRLPPAPDIHPGDCFLHDGDAPYPRLLVRAVNLNSKPTRTMPRANCWYIRVELFKRDRSRTGLFRWVEAAHLLDSKYMRRAGSVPNLPLQVPA